MGFFSPRLPDQGLLPLSRDLIRGLFNDVMPSFCDAGGVQFFTPFSLSHPSLLYTS